MMCEFMQHNVAQEIMRICTVFSDSELTRAKNVLRTNLLRQTGKTLFFNGFFPCVNLCG